MAELKIPNGNWLFVTGVILVLLGVGDERPVPVDQAGGQPLRRHPQPDGRPLANVTIEGTVAITEGKGTLKSVFSPDGSKEGGGTIKLLVNGQPAGEGNVKRSLFRHGLEPFEIGRDSITPVDPAYHDKGEFEFTGKIEKVSFELSGK